MPQGVRTVGIGTRAEPSILQGAEGMSKRPKYLPVVLATIAMALVAGAPSGALAQTYPAKHVRLIGPFGPGTTTDIVTRLVGNALGKELGQSVVIENRPGAGGAIGTNAVAKAPPDGYTPTLLVIPKSLPVQNVRELVALAKSRPEGISYASAGSGTSGHLAGELLKNKTGANMVHVPYKEGGMAMTDVITGQVQFMFYHPAAVLPHIQAGAMRAVGVSSARRSVAAPEVSTMIEQGLDDFDLVAWFALYAPAGTPDGIVARLREATDRVLGNAEIAKQLQVQGVELLPLKGEELMTFARNEVAKWTDLVKKSGAR